MRSIPTICGIVLLRQPGKGTANLDSEEDHWIGSRKDVLRRTPEGLKIVTRHIFLEQTVLMSRNLSSFF